MFIATFVIDGKINLPRSFRNKSGKCSIKISNKYRKWARQITQLGIEGIFVCSAQPITLIFYAPYREQCVTTVWKMANITPLPKTKIVKDPKKDLRPISLTASISKVAEEFFVVDYIKPSVPKVIDSNQYGAIPQSSTTWL